MYVHICGVYEVAAMRYAEIEIMLPGKPGNIDLIPGGRSGRGIILRYYVAATQLVPARKIIRSA